MAKKLIYIEGMVDHSIVFDLMTLLDGKAINMIYRPVKHGGEDENGTIKAAPSARDITLAFASSYDTFKPRELKKALAEQGRSTTNVYTQLTSLIGEGVMKRVTDGVYTLNKVKKVERRPRAKPGDMTVTDAIIDIVRGKQNGSGEGVNIKVIKDGLEKAGFNATGTSPAITTLMKKKQIKRVAPSMYRVEV